MAPTWSEGDDLLKLVNECLGDTTPNGNIRPNPLIKIEYSHTLVIIITTEDSDDKLEEPQQAGCQTCESDEDTAGTQTADEIVSASVTSGGCSIGCVSSGDQR